MSPLAQAADPFRLADASEAIRELVPPELAPLFWAITMLGSAKFLLITLALGYWNWHERRREILAVVSIAFFALTVTLSLKYWFALPRPPAAVQRYPVEPSPHGFPSGHAIAATIVYGGVLVTTRAYRDSRKLAGTAALVVLVGLSRVVLGVHYLGDILAGFAVGLVALGVLAVAIGDEPVRGFAASAACALPAVWVTGAGPDAILALGGSLGGLVASLRLGTYRPFRSTAERVAFNAAGVALIGIGLGLDELVETVVPAAIAVNFVLVFGIIALPGAVARSEWPFSGEPSA